MDKVQKRQEEQYQFPYHYIPQWSDGFTQTQTLRWGYVYASYLEFTVELLRERNPKKIVDIGCGDGRLIHEINKEMPDIPATGIDYSERAIAFAKAFTPDARFVCGNIFDPSFDCGLFDTATLIETLEHIPPDDIPSFVEGISRMLEKEGTLVVSVPSANIPTAPKHYQHFTLELLEDSVKPFFKKEKHFYINSNSLQGEIIKRILTNRIFSLQGGMLSNFLYRYYKKKLFHANAQNAGRILAMFKKN